MSSFLTSRRLVISGACLLGVAVLGFLTVADELRHIGEFFAVLGILLSGSALLLAGLFPRWSHVLALQWAPLGIGCGALAGAVVDKVVLGVVLGTAFGILFAVFRRTRPA